MVKTNIQTFTGEVEILSNLHLGDGSYYLTANADASNVVQITGNVGATFFVGDGGFLSNIATTLSDIVDQGNVVSNVVQFGTDTGVADYKGAGLVTDSNVGIQNTSPDHTLAIGDKVRVDDNTNELLGQSVIEVDGRILATRFEGDGGLLSNIATTLESIVNQGNVSANVVKFSSNALIPDYTGVGIVTDSNVGIQNTNPVFNLSVGSNLHVDDEGSNVLVVHGNVAMSNLNLGAFTVSPSHDLDQVCAEGNTVTRPVRFSNVITGISAASNIESAGTFISTDAERGIDVASNIDIGGRLKFDSNVFIDTLRVADIAANIVTYDSSTGELLDSSGTFMNKFAVVSEQPPSDFFANTTTVTNHGSYTLTTSNLATDSNTFNAFDGTANAWVSGGLEGGYIGGSNVFHEDNLTQLSNLHPTQFGDWLAIEFPYKTTLRHMKVTPLTAAQFPASANLYATNNDLTWTEVKYWNDVVPASDTAVQTITVDATEQFKKYALVATKAAGNSSNVAIQDWQLFTESFSIDGGKVAMAQQAATGGETVMDQSGPHSRLPKTVPLKKYPEIEFFYDKSMGNETTNTFSQAGYTVTASDAGTSVRRPWNVFSENADTNTGLWQTGTSNQYDTTTGAANTNAPLFEGSRGAWIKLELPKKIKVKSVFVRSLNNAEKVASARILGSNDDTNWNVIKDKYNLTYDISYADANLSGSYPYNVGVFAEDPVDSTTAYKYIVFQILSNRTGNNIQLYNLKYFGYEDEVSSLGDTSVDTTFTSTFNTPQTTGANVYVDGSLGETFTNRVVGPTVSNTHTTYVSAGKYWELSGNVESNVTIEANTFLSGDAPHSVSMWFKSSNLEANTSNSCIFSVGGTEEKFYYDAFDSTEVVSNTYEMHQQVGSYGAGTSDYLGGFGLADQGASISGDGSIFAVGVERDDDAGTDLGSVIVFGKDANGKWVENQKLFASDAGDGGGNDRFGRAVSVSKDGNYMIVGQRYHDDGDVTNNANAGAAWIFRKNPDSLVWEEKHKFLGPIAGDEFGVSVSISRDGTFVAVSSVRNNSFQGKVYVYKQTGTDGSQWDSGQTLVASDGASNHYFGVQVNLSADGNYLIVGAYLEDLGTGGTDSGAAYVFHRNGADGANQWDSNHYKLENSDAVSNSRFGSSVSISEDGTYVIVGAYGHTTFGRNYDGAAYIYTRSGTNTWGTEKELSRPDDHSLADTTGEHFGYSVAMSDDGTTCVVGAREADIAVGSTVYDRAGIMYVYNRVGTEWILKTKKIPAEIEGGSGGSRFGGVVSISSDGSYIVSTAYAQDGINGVENAGVAYIYTRDSVHGNVGGLLPDDFKIQSNTWHNLTYAYQGAGGLKTTYLDGRKISEELATDTYGEYPPMPMTSFETQDYRVIQSNVHQEDTTYSGWEAFDKQNNDGAKAWISWSPAFNNHVYLLDTNLGKRTGGFSTTVDGEYLILEMPHKLKVDFFKIKERGGNTDNGPKAGKLYGSNDGKYWTELTSFSNLTYTDTDDVFTYVYVRSTKGYSKLALVVTDIVSAASTWIGIGDLRYYGHKENDLVRLPDPMNVVMHPPMIMNDLAKRGYALEVSSSHSSTSFVGFNAEQRGFLFDGDDSTYWHAETNGTDDHRYDGTNNAYGTDSVANFDPTGINIKGEWFKLEFPRKVKISKVHLRARSGSENQAPKDFAFYGSNTAASGSWTLIQSFTGESPQDDGSSYYDITSNPAPYKYILMLVTRLVGTTAFSLAELRYFGTDEPVQVPIQIGGGNIDKVANFRVYDKFIDENQALEIWDAQKDEFGRVKSSMTLQKGRLGIGTTEPEGRLAVLDEPHSIEEFPPGAMRLNEYYFEGHGVFVASASSWYSSSYQPFEAFDDTKTNSSGEAWLCRTETGLYSINGYTTDSPANLGRYNGGNTRTPDGEFLILQLPYKVKISSATLRERVSSPERAPTAGYFYGSNDGKNWDILKHFSGLRYETRASSALQSYVPGVTDYAILAQDILINAEKAYSYLAIIPTHTSQSPEEGSAWVGIGDLRYFGVREQEQSVLHDGQLTLTKNLDVSRIGPPVTEYPTPQRTYLHMEWNTSLAIHQDQAVDTATSDGTQRNGDLTGGLYYDPGDHSFVADLDTHYIRQNQSSMAGDVPHTWSFWFKFNEVTSSRYLFYLGTGVNYQRVSLYFNGNELQYSFRGVDHRCEFMPEPNRWYHFGLTYNGNSARDTTADPCRKIYIDGIRQTAVFSGTRGALNLADSADLFVGISSSLTTSTHARGRYSMFRLWRRIALSDSEIWTLFKQGRVPKVNDIRMMQSTLSIGDFERFDDCHLQVGGRIRARGGFSSFTGQHVCFPDEPMEKGFIVSAKKNKYLKLNGGLDTGKRAITIDESLPIVSLSNVAQDKACFGVVSDMEKANTTRRTQVTGGFITGGGKTLGDNRAIVNSVGEGAIWVVNTNGSLESGDYITTSNVAGYGQKQDDDILHNYTVAKITMDCDFTGSNVAVQTIKREETGLRTITEDVWNTLVEYDRSSNTETQYSNTLVPSAYSGQSGYVPREVTTIVDYTDGSNLISIAEWSNLESNIQNTYQSNTFTEIADYTKFISLDEWSNLTVDVQNTYSEAEITTYYQIQRGENVLDENGQLQFEDKTGATEAPYERRFLDASGAQTDEANAVHIAAFVGCTYHCG